MKKSKKIVSLLLALAFAFSLMATTALAAVKDDTAQPNGWICPDCNINMRLETVVTRDWYRISVKDCIHHPFGEDFVLGRDIRKTWVCDRCGLSRPGSNTTETRNVCKGYDFSDVV